MNVKDLTKKRVNWLNAAFNDSMLNAFVVSEDSVIERTENVIDYELADEVKGGIIVFSVDVSVAPVIKNKITEKHNISHWSIGNFFKGKYTDKSGGVFTEKSLSVEVIGVTCEQLIEIVEDLCKEFKQVTVLVKSYSTNKILLIT